MSVHVNGRDIPEKGENVSWSTLGGESYSGIVVQVDSNVVYVRCEDGEVRCSEW